MPAELTLSKNCTLVMGGALVSSLGSEALPPPRKHKQAKRFASRGSLMPVSAQSWSTGLRKPSTSYCMQKSCCSQRYCCKQVPGIAVRHVRSKEGRFRYTKLDYNFGTQFISFKCT